MPKITFLGAGSTIFTRNLIGDILSYPELTDSTINLFDIDEKRLAESQDVAHWIVGKLGVHSIIQATTDRRAALDGADYAIAMFQVGGYKPSTVVDFDIPKKYGLRHTVNDTIGVGGIMRAMRTVPVMLEMAQEMEELCPDVTLLNYVNPMAVNCWALNRASKIRIVGFCHSVQGTAAELAHDIGVPIEEINYLCAGINHMSFYLQFERNGEDLYPLIQQVIDEDRVPSHNRVRYEMFKRLGYFVTESSEHFSEYVPWFIKRDRPDLIKKFNIPLDDYLDRCQAQVIAWGYAQEVQNNLATYEEGELHSRLSNLRVLPHVMEWLIENVFENMQEFVRSHEYGSGVIHSIETGTPRVVNGNVINHGLIDNLPQGCCVEVPCLVDKNGIQPVRVGALPPHLAAIMQTNINLVVAV